MGGRYSKTAAAAAKATADKAPTEKGQKAVKKCFS